MLEWNGGTGRTQGKIHPDQTFAALLADFLDPGLYPSLLLPGKTLQSQISLLSRKNLGHSLRGKKGGNSLEMAIRQNGPQPAALRDKFPGMKISHLGHLSADRGLYGPVLDLTFQLFDH